VRWLYATAAGLMWGPIAGAWADFLGPILLPSAVPLDPSQWAV
jgi:hypothetical protein